MTEAPRHNKVLKLRILKPVGDLDWDGLGQLLREVRYRVFRLANLAISEHYLNYHKWRTGQLEELPTAKISALNKRLWDMLNEEAKKKERENLRVLTQKGDGALPSNVVDALAQNKIRAVTQKAKWQQVVRGQASLPTYKLEMAVPVRCDKPELSRMERTADGEVELDLRVCTRPYPRIRLATGNLSDGAKAVLDRLLDNPAQDPQGYRQRAFEVKQDARDRKWYLFVSYDFPAETAPHLSADRIVGVDLGFKCPVYAAISHGHARLGYRQFSALMARIRTLQKQTIARRRSIQRGGRADISAGTARSGHGRKRKLQAVEKLQGRIDDAYTTLNHQLSAAVIKFALNNGAGVIQMEDLQGLTEVLSGSYLGANWRYHELQQFIEYKAKEHGIELRKVNPKYTSRRCSKCGHIHIAFSRKYRDANGRTGFNTRFVCPKCEYTADSDYNAARNLAVDNIAAIIQEQCGRQEISYDRADETSQDASGL